MKPLGEVLNVPSEHRKPRDDEYLGDQGLLYCRNCRTPRQLRITLGSHECVVPVLCKCQQEAQEQEDLRVRAADHAAYIRRLKATGIQESHLRDYTFANAEDGKYVRMASRYVEQWDTMLEKNLGLLFWGEVGSGKTFLAACIANALLDRGVPVLMTNFPKILNQMGGLYSEERHKYIASFSQFQLLIVDDLGVERGSEFAMEQVYSLIDERYKSGLPMIITTNLKIQDLRNPSDVARARIYSRILEMCTPVCIPGKDRREVIGKTKLDVVNDLLFPQGVGK